VTVVRNDGTLPLRLAPDQTLGLVVFHSPRFGDEAARFAAEIARRHPRTEFVDIASVAPSAAAAALERLRGAAAVVVGTYQFGPTSLDAQARFLSALTAGRAPVLTVSLMNPTT